MGLEGTRFGGLLTGTEVRRGDESPAETETLPLTDGRTGASTSSDTFISGTTTVVPDTSLRPAVGHPLLCRDVPAEAPSGTAVMSAEDFEAFFECRMETIEGHIEAGRMEEASRLLRETNAAWRSFNAAHREIPQSERNAFLGRLYLARARIEETYGDRRAAHRAYYEARGHELSGDRPGALRRYRDFLRRTEMTDSEELSIRREESLAAVNRLGIEQIRSRMENVFAWREEIIPTGAQRVTREDLDLFLERVEGLIADGEADTIDEAVEMLGEEYRRGMAAAPVVRAGHLARAGEDLSAVRLEGGVLEIFGPGVSEHLHVIVGREGGMVRTGGGLYYFPPSDREVHVEFHRTVRGRTYEVTEDGERNLVRGTDWFGPGDSFPAGGRTLIGVRTEHLRGRVELEHPEMTEEARAASLWERIFDGEGRLGGDRAFTAIVSMEGEEAGARLGDPEEYRGLLMEQAREIGFREGSYAVANELLMQVFEEDFNRALAEVQADDAVIAGINADSETDEEFYTGVMEAATARMGAWAEAGELSGEASAGWELYNDWFDPNGEILNITAESGHLLEDELFITAATALPAMATGGVAGEAVAATRVARWSNVMLRLGTRCLLRRFGPRMVARGLLVARVGARAAFVAPTRVAVETPIMGGGSAILHGRDPLSERSITEMGHTARTLGIFHAVGTTFSGLMGLFFRSRAGEGITRWAEGSASRTMVVRGGVGVGSLGTMTATATAMSDPSEGNLAERLLAEGARMLGMTLLGGIAESLTAAPRGGRSTVRTVAAERVVERPVAGPSGPSFWSRAADLARGVAYAPMWIFMGGGGPGGSAIVRFGRGRLIPYEYRTTFEAGGGVIRARVGERTSYLLREAGGTQRTVGREAYDAYRNWLAGRHESLSRTHDAVATGERGLRGLMEDFAGEGYDRTPVADFLLRSEQLRPTSRVSVGGRTFYLSPVIRTMASDGPRTYCLGLTPVIEGGRVRLREVIFYRSNSDGTWRSAPYRLGNHLAKGRFRGPEERGPTHYTQETQVAPEIAVHLEGLESHGDPIEMSEGALSLIINVEAELNRGRGESMLGRFGREVRFSLTPGLRPVQEFRPGHLDAWADGTAIPVGEGLPTMEIFRSRFGLRVDALRSLTYPDGFIPDFSGGPLREYTGRHTLLGETTYREYEGRLNGEPVVWTVAEAAGDRVWIQGIRFRDVLVTDYGTYDRVIDSGILTSKPLEYTSQLGNLAPEYRRSVERTDGGPSHYEDITPLLAELEPVRRYREARDAEPTVVEPVAARRIIVVGSAEAEAIGADPVRDTIEILPEDRPTMPPPEDMPRGAPRPVIVEEPAARRTFPRAATAVRLAVSHANAHLSDTTGYRFAVEAEVIRSSDGDAPVVAVRVAGPEAELAFLNTLRETSAGVSVENLGDGSYRVHDPSRGDSVVTIRRGFELSVGQQRDLGDWLGDLPPGETEGMSLGRYPMARLESLVDHLVARRWPQSQIVAFFESRGAGGEGRDIMSRRSDRGGRSEGELP